jgi:hypothetical protein
MNTQTYNQLYYLQDNTDRDMHDTMCCCDVPQPLPHRAVGASLCKLDIPGLKALNDYLMGVDDVSFFDWLAVQESEGTYYGSCEDAAIAAAIAEEACREGKLIVNYPEHFPWIHPLIEALRGLVGFGGKEPDGYLPQTACECDNTHERNKTVCRICYARLVCNVISSFIYNYLRMHGNK